MIDIHSHLLPGVDDGSPSAELSLPVLRRFGEQGVDVLICTPHLNASDAGRAPVEQYSRILEDLVRQAPPRPVLRLGFEIMLDVPGADLRSPDLHLGGSTAALVEFPRMSVPRESTQELARLRASGVVPVVAHPERYFGCSPEKVAEWRGVGAVIQMDAAMILGGESSSKLSRALLEEGLVDVIASDNHGDRRSLAAAERWLREAGGEEQARLLTHVNAERLLSGQVVLPVQPLPTVERGMRARLRELLFGPPAR
ncbi:MAG: hypothetical protein M3068_13240 [Gemmatimonadota bacterium]|nr:hypothetical protein [Gemmatimonadota bacterium]